VVGHAVDDLGGGQPPIGDADEAAPIPTGLHAPCVGPRDEAVDGFLERDEEWNTPRLSRRLVSLAKKPSTAFGQDAEVGPYVPLL
jgi:hypothetical protein